MKNNPAIILGRPGSARVEYFACRADVEAMLQQGYSVRMVYERMKEEGQVTCSYSAFWDYVRGGGKRLHSKKTGRPKSPAAAPQNTAGRKTASQFGDSFPDSRTMNVKDAI